MLSGNIKYYIWVCIVILFSGAATKLTGSLDTWDDAIGLFIIFIVTLVAVYDYRFKLINNRYVYSLLVLLTYFTVSSIYCGELHFKFLGIWLLNLLIAYLLVNVLKEKFFIIYEDVIYFLSVIAFAFYCLHMLFPEFLIGVVRMINISAPRTENVDSSVIFYTINNSEYLIDKSFLNDNLTRNSGYAWEPGIYAVHLSLAIYFNIIRNNYNINFRLLFLLVSLLSTQSTTGMVMLMVIMLFYVSNKKYKYKFLAYIMISFIIGYVYGMDFVGMKIYDLYGEDVGKIIREARMFHADIAPQRFTSFIIDFNDFLQHPLFGYGGHLKYSILDREGVRISTISGIGKVFAVYGIFGVIAFVLILRKTSIAYSELYNYKGKYYFFAMIMFLSISYSTIFWALMLAFWMYGVLIESNSKDLIFTANAPSHLSKKLK